MKLANDLAQIKKTPENDGEEDEEEAGNENNDDQAQQNKKKKKNKLKDSKTRVTVVENEESLNAPLQKQAGLFHRMEESGNSSGLLNVRLFVKNFELLIKERSKKILWAEESSEISETDVINSSILHTLPDSTICPSFQKFVIDEWNVDMDNTLNDSFNQTVR